jgi:ATP/maltotriose-dependent transcriptional regulator MalT
MHALSEDVHAAMNAAVVRARLHLALAEPAEALAALGRQWRKLPSRMMYGEYLATVGLAHAVAGDLDAATEALTKALDVSEENEARIPAEIARGLVAVRAGRSDADAMIGAAFEEAARAANYDAVVVVFRSAPDVLDRLWAVTAFQPTIRHILDRTHDDYLSRRIGLPRHRRRGGADELSQRELEVLELVAQARTNREIARSLWISETTVKVHLRHIYGKLGVKRRTEAAIAAQELLRRRG